MKVYGVIYLLINGINDKEYVGQTTRTVEERFNEHKRGDQYIDHAIQKYGADMFVIAILKVCYSKEELDKWERHMIRSRDTKAPNGYNLTDGGEGMGHYDQDTCDKIAESSRGNKNWLGRHHTEATGVKLFIAKRSESHYKNLIAEIDKHKLCYRSLSKLMGIDVRQLSNKMLGKVRFTSTEVSKLVKIFDKPAEYLMVRDDEKIFLVARKMKESPYKNLAAILNERHISYKLLAKILKITPGSVSGKMLGNKNFTLVQKEVIRDFLDVAISVEELFQRADGFKSPSRLYIYPVLTVELKRANISLIKLAVVLGFSSSTSILNRMLGKPEFNEKEKAAVRDLLGIDMPLEVLFSHHD